MAGRALKTVRWLFRICFLLMISVLVSACFGWDSSVPERIDDFRSQIVIGQTSRNTVHERLGEPFISDKRFEVYRVLEGGDVLVTVFVVWEIRDVILYALVVYDDNDVVDDIDWAIYQHDDQSDPNKTVPLLRSARLHVGGYYFAAFSTKKSFFGFFHWRREEILLAPPSVSRRSLVVSPPSGMCSVLLFLKQMEDPPFYHRPVYLDDEPVLVIPVVDVYYLHKWLKPYSSDESWHPYYQDIFTKLLVPVGEHELKITTSLRPSEFRRKFNCRGGEVLYVYPLQKLVDSEPYGFYGYIRKKVEGDIEIYNQPIESYEGWKRLLFYSGKWFGND